MSPGRPSASLPADDRGNRPEQDLDVEPQRPAVDVLEVALDPSIEVGLTPRADLPEAGDTGLHRQPAPVPHVVPRDLGRKRRRGPTRLISPRRTFHSWGSSSSDDRRNKAP